MPADTHRLFQIYSAGNFIEATPTTPFVQIGETKYGKPILDRIVTHDCDLIRMTKCALLSYSSTIRSNLSVAPPIDIAIYRRDSFQTPLQINVPEGDVYFDTLCDRYGQGLIDMFNRLPDPAWLASVR